MSIYKLSASVPGPQPVKEPVFPAWFLTRGPVGTWLYFTTDDRPFHADNFALWSDSPTMPTGAPEGEKPMGQAQIEQEAAKIRAERSSIPAAQTLPVAENSSVEAAQPSTQTPPGSQVDALAERIAREILAVQMVGSARHDNLTGVIAAQLAPLVERSHRLEVSQIDINRKWQVALNFGKKKLATQEAELAQLRADLAAAKEELKGSVSGETFWRGKVDYDHEKEMRILAEKRVEELTDATLIDGHSRHRCSQAVAFWVQALKENRDFLENQLSILQSALDAARREAGEAKRLRDAANALITRMEAVESQATYDRCQVEIEALIAAMQQEGKQP